jgi:hypothetical protein
MPNRQKAPGGGRRHMAGLVLSHRCLVAAVGIALAFVDDAAPPA